MELNNIKELLVNKEPNTFKGAKLNHSLRFIKMLQDHANGISNLKELPIKYLNLFFRSANTRGIVIEKLIELSVIERTDGYIPGAKSKSYRLTNDYLPENKKSNMSIMKMNIDGSVDEDVFFNATNGPKGYVEMFGEPADTSKTITIRYKGFGEPEEITFTKDDNKIVKEVKDNLGEVYLEDIFVGSLMNRGFSKTKAWFYYRKYNNN
jgi:hypothetical protein